MALAIVRDKVSIAFWKRSTRRLPVLAPSDMCLNENELRNSTPKIKLEFIGIFTDKFYDFINYFLTATNKSASKWLIKLKNNKNLIGRCAKLEGWCDAWKITHMMTCLRITDYLLWVKIFRGAGKKKKNEKKFTVLVFHQKLIQHHRLKWAQNYEFSLSLVNDIENLF